MCNSSARPASSPELLGTLHECVWLAGQSELKGAIHLANWFSTVTLVQGAHMTGGAWGARIQCLGLCSLIFFVRALEGLTCREQILPLPNPNMRSKAGRVGEDTKDKQHKKTQTNPHANKQTRPPSRTCARTHTRTHAHKPHTLACAYTRTHTRVRARPHTHTHAHTHTHTH
jgi:hypothetical protein